MSALHITAIDLGTRRPIKRQAHLFSLLTVLALAGAGLYVFLPDARSGPVFWSLVIAAVILSVLTALFWVFERPQETLLFGSTHSRPRKQLE